MTPLAVLALSLGLLQAPAAGAPPKPAAPAQVASPVDMTALALQVALDRAGFSPGAIDGVMGGNTKKAAEAVRQAGNRDLPTAPPPVVSYTITAADVEGPFGPALPADLMAQAQLPALAYTSPLEMLAERFHATPSLLQRLNPGAQFVAGEQVQVPNVEMLVAPVEKLVPSPQGQAAAKTDAAGTGGRRGAPRPAQPNTLLQRPDVVVMVSKASSALTVKDADGGVLFYAPVTTGSEHDPLPIGEWKVKGIQFNPPFNYNPELFWDADPAHSKAKLPPGPNNPVGLVWIDLDREHYGIHGTPEPTQIGRAESHGCVRMTNWDALRVAGLVKPGTRVVFAE